MYLRSAGRWTEHWQVRRPQLGQSSCFSRLPRLVLMEMRVPRKQAEMCKYLVKFATIPLAKVGHKAKPRVSVGGQYQRVQAQGA